MIDNDRIGRTIKTLREKAGMTQKQLADKLFVSSMAVSKWERGKSMPDVATLRTLSVLLDMDVDGIIDGSATFTDCLWKGVLLLDPKDGVSAETLIFDKPLIDYLISYFLLAGIRDIDIFCDGEEGKYIDMRYAGGMALGAHLSFFSWEGRPKNSVSHPANTMLVSAPLFIYGVDLTRFFQRAMQRQSEIVGLTNVVGASGAEFAPGYGGRSEGGYTHYYYRSIPICFIHKGVFALIDQSHAIRDSLFLSGKKGEIDWEPLDKGFVVSNLSNESDIQNISVLVKIIQELGSYILYCPLEIAWRRGMISRKQMLEHAKLLGEYQTYLESL